MRRRRRRIPSAGRATTELTDLDIGRLEGIAVLRANRDDLIALLNIAQLAIHLFPHSAVVGELHLGRLAVARRDRDRVARHLTNRPGHPAAVPTAETALTTLTTLTALTAAALVEELLRSLRPILLACPNTYGLPAIEAEAGHQEQRDNPDDSFP